MRSPSFYAWLSVATSIVTIALKFGAYALTGSVGLLSDAIEAIVNIVAALVALIILAYSAHAPDREHNFGHEKAQYFSSGIEGALIFVAAGGIIWAAIPRLFAPRELEQVGLGVVLSLAAAAANALCATIMLRAAKVHRSITLEADARHLLTDVWTTAGVLVAVVLVQFTGWLRLDPIIAIIVALQILWTGWTLISRSFQGLMDRAVPDEDQEKIVEVLSTLHDRGCTALGDGPVDLDLGRPRRCTHVHQVCARDRRTRHGQDLEDAPGRGRQPLPGALHGLRENLGKSGWQPLGSGIDSLDQELGEVRHAG